MRKREKHITRLHIILFFLVIIISFSVFFGIKAKTKVDYKKYKKYEEMMVDGAKNYMNLEEITLDEGEEEKIELSKLVKRHLVYGIPSECKGYVLVIYEENIESELLEMDYNAFIKCGKKYTTINYSEY